MHTGIAARYESDFAFEVGTVGDLSCGSGLNGGSGGGVVRGGGGEKAVRGGWGVRGRGYVNVEAMQAGLHKSPDPCLEDLFEVTMRAVAARCASSLARGYAALFHFCPFGGCVVADTLPFLWL